LVSRIIKSMILPWLIWGTAVLCYFNQYFLRISVNGLAPDLVRNYHINALSLSIVAASFYYAYMLMQVPGGILVDRYGPRLILTFSTLLCALGCAIFTVFDTVYFLSLGRFVMGAGAAFALIGTLNLARVWFSQSQFTMISGFTLMVGTIGALLGGAPLIELCRAFPMHIITGAATVITTLLSILVWFTVRDSPVSVQKSIIQSPFFSTLVESMRSKTVWLAALLAGFLFAPITVFAGLWCIPFLTVIYGDTILVKHSSAIIFIGLAVGAILTAKFSQWTQSTVFIIRCCAVVSLLAMIVITEGGHIPPVIMLILLFLLGFCIAGYMLLFTVVSKVVSKQASATAFGLTNFFQVCIGSLLLPLMGYLLMLGKTMFHGSSADQYSVLDYQHSMIIMPISLLCALVLSFCLKEVGNSDV